MREKIRDFMSDMGYEKKSEFLGEAAAAVSMFILLFMISIIGG